MLLHKPKIKETIEFPKSIYSFTEEGIVIVSIKDNAHMELVDTLIEYRAMQEKVEYLPARILVKPGQNTSISKEVREFVNKPSSKALVLCQAILVDNLAHKIIANFMMKLYKQPGAFKVFSNEEEAINWLREFER